MANFINEEFKITFAVPEALRHAIELAEQADRDNNFGAYINYADNIDIVAKNCCADGAISQKAWDILVCRYVL